MTDLEFRQHQVERWREINWLAMWRMIGVFYAMDICCQCDSRSEALVQPQAGPVAATRTGAMRGNGFDDEAE